MEHVYKNIPFEAWFDYKELYEEMVKLAPDNSWFVEIGSFKGRSAAFMAVEIINSGKNIKLDCVDIFNWIYEGDDKIIGEIFSENMEKYGLTKVVNKIIMNSHEASLFYEDESLDFVFVDGNHTYEGVKEDIESYLPKVKVGGYLCGHDFNSVQYPTLNLAVENTLGIKNVRTTKNGTCFIYQKKKEDLLK